VGDGLYRAWPTKDGHVAIVIIENRQFEAVMRVLGREDAIGDKRFENLVARIMNAPALYEMWVASYQGASGWLDSSNALWPDVRTNDLTPQGDDPDAVSSPG
jgi:hypothetical protein